MDGKRRASILRSEVKMFLNFAGAMLILAGIIFSFAQPLWRGQLSRGQSRESQNGTLEPRRPAIGLDWRTNWPGLIMIVLGTLILLVQAVR